VGSVGVPGAAAGTEAATQAMTIIVPPGTRFKVPDEKQVQRAVLALFSLCGWKMGSTSQYRASRVMQGLPDLVGHHLGIRRFMWWETKAPLARWPRMGMGAGAVQWINYNPHDRSTWRSKPLRPDQEVFRNAALQCNELHGWGGSVEAEEFMITLGLGERLPSGVFQPRFGARDRVSR
jgi:hypothetical protein